MSDNIEGAHQITEPQGDDLESRTARAQDNASLLAAARERAANANSEGARKVAELDVKELEEEQKWADASVEAGQGNDQAS